MKLTISTLLLSLSLFSCAQSSKENYDPTSIIGCWDIVDVSCIVESNFPPFDSLALAEQEADIKERIGESHISKYTESLVYRFDKMTKKVKPELTAEYIIEGDSIFRTSLLL